MQEHNEVLLTKDFLVRVLTYLSVRLFDRFRTTVRIVIHGGAVMVLHPSLSCRMSTRDVDYNHRSFESHWIKRGVPDAGARLIKCIEETALAFQLGADWMNAHADVALPMARDPYGKLVDPIYNDAVTPQNVAMNTVFESQGLVLVGVSWSWAVALKLIRYQKDDPGDIAAILKLGTEMRGCQWTVELIEGWLNKLCSPMGYQNYSATQLQWNRAKMQDAVKRAQQLNWAAATTSYQPPPTLINPWSAHQRQQQRPHPAHNLSRPLTMAEGSADHERMLSSQARRRTRSFSALPSAHTSFNAPPTHSTSRAFVPPVPSLPVPTPPSASATPVYYYYYNQPAQRQRHVPVSVPPQPAATVTPTTYYAHSHQTISRPATQPPPPAAMSIPSAPTPVSSLPPGFVPTHYFPRIHHPAVHRVAMMG
ncbi:hypothetical protein PsYK624_067910 [Phanerochaete sordida]|uniref:Uncharacterized protein n=1 Tax=Phanerochaete sordida TaxID=48140 RepID=A0A9P3G9R5_9APHY|nr:hypothetical protein PsYK624_067910 [Phanerochaete sordida]